ncbi:flagellar hook-length control protein FliK [Hyphococcus sp.]|jgi:flagellar hook-length control protein FliK|uniref:flagellar hook-length control protein FliK n=1 Tax=Hyphococcus sp. TaxID=2038636 RepID=UPI003D136875
MDLGNINLRLPASSASGEQGGAKGQKKSGEAPAEGGFAGLIASLLSAARGETKPVGEGAESQATPLKAGGPVSAQALAADAAAAQAALTNGAGKAPANGQIITQLSGVQPNTNDIAAKAEQAPRITPLVTAKTGMVPVSPQKSPLQNAAPASEFVEMATVDGEARLEGKAAQNPEAVTAKNQDALLKGASAAAKPVQDKLAEIQVQLAPGRESSELALREATGAISTGSAPEASGVKPSAPSVQSGAQNIVAQVAQQLTHAVRGGMQHIRFQLHPAELGQVSVQLKIRDGAAKVVITADNPAAVESMRQAAGALHQSLQSAGVQLDREHLYFQQQDGGAMDQFTSGDEARRNGDDNTADDNASASRRQEANDPQQQDGKNDGIFL